MTRYELEVKMLVDSWIYGGIAELIEKMPEGVLGVNVLGIKKQEGAWDTTCLPSVMREYEEDNTRKEEDARNHRRNSSDLLIKAMPNDEMDSKVEAYKKITEVYRRLGFLNKGKTPSDEGFIYLTQAPLENSEYVVYTLSRTSLYDIGDVHKVGVDSLHDYVFNKLEPNRKEEARSKKEGEVEINELESLESYFPYLPPFMKLRFDNKFVSGYGYWDIKFFEDQTN